MRDRQWLRVNSALQGSAGDIQVFVFEVPHRRSIAKNEVLCAKVFWEGNLLAQIQRRIPLGSGDNQGRLDRVQQQILRRSMGDATRLRVEDDFEQLLAGQ